MGKYFVMSTRHNKRNASDFGFISRDLYTAVNPIDDSIWIKKSLYDFGWGRENGFYKIPLPDFEMLFKIVLVEENDDDVYGAAAIILEKYAEELLLNCETIIANNSRKNDFKRLVRIFRLEIPLNRCSTLNKSLSQIKDDYERWKIISQTASKI